MFEIREGKDVKILKSENYNYFFNKKNGLFIRYGKTPDDDPNLSPFGPEILDLEISTSVHDTSLYPKDRLVYDGGCKGDCSFCYKSNGNYPTYNMTFDEFKNIFHKMGKQLTQVAFGIMNLETNPDFFKMASYAKDNGVIPNFTMHPYDRVSKVMAQKISSIFGAVAISYYDKNKALKVAKTLHDAGMKQVNIHFMLSQETFGRAMGLLESFKKDPWFSYINAVVFLSLKKKGRGKDFHILQSGLYKKLVDFAIQRNIPIGFDSCSAHKFLNAVKDRKDYNKFETFCEPCESGVFSSYINAKGEFYPCSFLEGQKSWERGISVLEADSFIDVWNDEKLSSFREALLGGNRHCPIFSI